MRRIFALLVLSCATGAAPAQDFPSRAVHLVVPFTPGTGADILARVIGPKLAERWKVAVVTENRAGATGNIGAELVAKSAPDGHTLLFTATSFGTNPALRPSPFDPVKSFAPVSVVATSALAVVVNPQLPAKSVKDLVEQARAQPGKLHYASPGSGGVQHLAMELLKLETRIDLVHVPYKGMGGAIQDLIGGQVQASIVALQTVAPHVRAGRLRMLAVMSGARAPAFPEVPTLREQGLSELEVETWYGVLAPAGTPTPVVSAISAQIDSVLADAALRELLAKQGLAAAGGGPERFAALLARELARWARVAAQAGIKAD
jgi:tripartite-type tricarboxylate transporter receptor subunit TctC